ncbi:MAG: glycosyltransferase [Chrysiogenales bacterium]|nr:MAG: glycosyltransferase [Chrysiogenales bacterium]
MSKAPLHIAFVGNYSPRLCGIATFTTDLCEATAKRLGPRSHVFAVAVNDTDQEYAYPSRVEFTLQKNQQSDYFEAANFINASNTDVVCVQHEYGIYGGWDGVYILSLISSLSVPVVVVLHTVLKAPTPNQKKIIQEMAQRAGQLVVMSELAVSLLQEVYAVPAGKITRLFHGTPDFTSLDNRHYKKRFQVEGNQTLLTFGLLSPNKGIETVIHALPGLVREFPKLIYIVLGKTHPNVRKEYGEKYRTGLVALVDKLGLQEHVIFDDRFVSLEELYAWLMATDIYITPYLNEAQIVSGTLSYAFGAGTAIISTPYWYAKELLAEGRGDIDRLCRFRSAGGDPARPAVRQSQAEVAACQNLSIRAANALGNRRGKVPGAVPAYGGGRGKKVDDAENSSPAFAYSALRPGALAATDRWHGTDPACQVYCPQPPYRLLPGRQFPGPDAVRLGIFPVARPGRQGVDLHFFQLHSFYAKPRRALQEFNGLPAPLPG